ncbi:MAG: MarR family transcriptional regulator [Coriobacteriales bacterium]|jgi:uncharacterized membrane protein|nr:MarR family transcriptional regulator [Coriobacteriales bacterium]
MTVAHQSEATIENNVAEVAEIAESTTITDNTSTTKNDRSAETATAISARVAVYDDLLSSPRIIDIQPTAIPEFIEDITVTTYENARTQGGSLPYTVIREIAENFIHADFKECTVSVLNGGNTVRFADQGPGIEKKDLVLQPGISSATTSMKQYIRGVGSGFPIVCEYLGRSDGFLTVDDNAVDGTVITLSVVPVVPSTATGVVAPSTTATAVAPNATATTVAPHASAALQATPQAALHIMPPQASPQASPPASLQASPPTPTHIPPIQLKKREEKALFLLYQEGTVGSGDLVEPLGVSAPTATRLLQRLEQLGLVETSASKKRILSNSGLAYIQAQSLHT